MVNLSRDIDNLDHFIEEFRCFPDDKTHITQISREIRVYVENCYRLTSNEIYKRVLASLHKLILDLLSGSVSERIAGLAVINEVIDASYIDESKITRFASVLHLCLYNAALAPTTHELAMLEYAAQTLGHLALAGGLVASDPMLKELRNALAHLRGPDCSKPEHISAMLVLLQLISNVPTLVGSYVDAIFDIIWTPIRDHRISIRTLSSEILQHCLLLIQRRPSRNMLYSKVFLQIQHCFADSTPEALHGGLLALGKMLTCTKDYVLQRLDDVTDMIFKHQDHRERLIRDTVLSLIPRLINYAPQIFIRSNSQLLNRCIMLLVSTLSVQCSSTTADTVFLAISDIALAIGPSLAPKLDLIISLVKDGLTMKANKKPSVAALSCVASLAFAVRRLLLPYSEDLVTLMFESGISDSLVRALSALAFYVPELLRSIQVRLLTATSLILSKNNDPSNISLLNYNYDLAQNKGQLQKGPHALTGPSTSLTSGSSAIDTPRDTVYSSGSGGATSGGTGSTSRFKAFGSSVLASIGAQLGVVEHQDSEPEAITLKNETLIILALQILWSFPFPSDEVLGVVSQRVVPFLDSKDPLIRQNAAVCCCSVLLRGQNTHSGQGMYSQSQYSQNSQTTSGFYNTHGSSTNSYPGYTSDVTISVDPAVRDVLSRRFYPEDATVIATQSNSAQAQSQSQSSNTQSQLAIARSQQEYLRIYLQQYLDDLRRNNNTSEANKLQKQGHASPYLDLSRSSSTSTTSTPSISSPLTKSTKSDRKSFESDDPFAVTDSDSDTDSTSPKTSKTSKMAKISSKTSRPTTEKFKTSSVRDAAKSIHAKTAATTKLQRTGSLSASSDEDDSNNVSTHWFRYLSKIDTEPILPAPTLAKYALQFGDSDSENTDNADQDDIYDYDAEISSMNSMLLKKQNQTQNTQTQTQQMQVTTKPTSTNSTTISNASLLQTAVYFDPSTAVTSISSPIAPPPLRVPSLLQNLTISPNVIKSIKKTEKDLLRASCQYSKEIDTDSIDHTISGRSQSNFSLVSPINAILSDEDLDSGISSDISRMSSVGPQPNTNIGQHYQHHPHFDPSAHMTHISQRDFRSSERHSLIVSTILERILSLTVTDSVSVIRTSILCLLDDRFDDYLIKIGALNVLFSILNDSSLTTRELAVSIICRLAAKCPAVVIPSIRNRILESLYTVQLSGSPTARFEAACLLTRIASSPYIHKLLRCFAVPILKVLVMQLLPSPNASSGGYGGGNGGSSSGINAISAGIQSSSALSRYAATTNGVTGDVGNSGGGVSIGVSGMSKSQPNTSNIASIVTPISTLSSSTTNVMQPLISSPSFPLSLSSFSSATSSFNSNLTSTIDISTAILVAVGRFSQLGGPETLPIVFPIIPLLISGIKAAAETLVAGLNASATYSSTRGGAANMYTNSDSSSPSASVASVASIASLASIASASAAMSMTMSSSTSWLRSNLNPLWGVRTQVLLEVLYRICVAAGWTVGPYSLFPTLFPSLVTLSKASYLYDVRLGATRLIGLLGVSDPSALYDISSSDTKGGQGSVGSSPGSSGSQGGLGTGTSVGSFGRSSRAGRAGRSGGRYGGGSRYNTHDSSSIHPTQSLIPASLVALSSSPSSLSLLSVLFDPTVSKIVSRFEDSSLGALVSTDIIEDELTVALLDERRRRAYQSGQMDLLLLSASASQKAAALAQIVSMDNEGGNGGDSGNLVNTNITGMSGMSGVSPGSSVSLPLSVSSSPSILISELLKSELYQFEAELQKNAVISLPFSVDISSLRDPHFTANVSALRVLSKYNFDVPSIVRELHMNVSDRSGISKYAGVVGGLGAGIGAAGIAGLGGIGAGIGAGIESDLMSDISGSSDMICGPGAGPGAGYAGDEEGAAGTMDEFEQDPEIEIEMELDFHSALHLASSTTAPSFYTLSVLRVLGRVLRDQALAFEHKTVITTMIFVLRAHYAWCEGIGTGTGAGSTATATGKAQQGSSKDKREGTLPWSSILQLVFPPALLAYSRCDESDDSSSSLLLELITSLVIFSKQDIIPYIPDIFVIILKYWTKIANSVLSTTAEILEINGIGNSVDPTSQIPISPNLIHPQTQNTTNTGNTANTTTSNLAPTPTDFSMSSSTASTHGTTTAPYIPSTVNTRATVVGTGIPTSGPGSTITSTSTPVSSSSSATASTSTSSSATKDTDPIGTHSPLGSLVVARQMALVVRALSETQEDETQLYVPRLLSLLLTVITNDISETRILSEYALRNIQIITPCIESYLHMVLPCLQKLWCVNYYIRDDTIPHKAASQAYFAQQQHGNSGGGVGSSATSNKKFQFHSISKPSIIQQMKSTHVQEQYLDIESLMKMSGSTSMLHGLSSPASSSFTASTAAAAAGSLGAHSHHGPHGPHGGTPLPDYGLGYGVERMGVDVGYHSPPPLSIQLLALHVTSYVLYITGNRSCVTLHSQSVILPLLKALDFACYSYSVVENDSIAATMRTALATSYNSTTSTSVNFVHSAYIVPVSYRRQTGYLKGVINEIISTLILLIYQLGPSFTLYIQATQRLFDQYNTNFRPVTQMLTKVINEIELSEQDLHMRICHTSDMMSSQQGQSSRQVYGTASHSHVHPNYLSDSDLPGLKDKNLRNIHPIGIFDSLENIVRTGIPILSRLYGFSSFSSDDTKRQGPLLAQSVRQDRLTKPFDVSQRITSEDWSDWLRVVNINLVKESPSLTVRLCLSLVQKIPFVQRALFNVAFLSCWAFVIDSYRDGIIRSIETALFSQTASVEVVDCLLDLHDYLTRADQGLPLEIKRLCDISTLRSLAPARALRYQELEFTSQLNPFGFETTIEIGTDNANTNLSDSSNTASSTASNMISNISISGHSNSNAMISTEDNTAVIASISSSTNTTKTIFSEAMQTMENFLRLYNRLRQPTAAIGILRLAKSYYVRHIRRETFQYAERMKTGQILWSNYGLNHSNTFVNVANMANTTASLPSSIGTGSLTFANIGSSLQTGHNYGQLDVKESWYERLFRWEDALMGYERKQLLQDGIVTVSPQTGVTSGANVNTSNVTSNVNSNVHLGVLLTPPSNLSPSSVLVPVPDSITLFYEINLETILGRLRCLEALGEIERMIHLATDIWNAIQASKYQLFGGGFQQHQSNQYEQDLSASTINQAYSIRTRLNDRDQHGLPNIFDKKYNVQSVSPDLIQLPEFARSILSTTVYGIDGSGGGAYGSNQTLPADEPEINSKTDFFSSTQSQASSQPPTPTPASASASASLSFPIPNSSTTQNSPTTTTATATSYLSTPPSSPLQVFPPHLHPYIIELALLALRGLHNLGAWTDFPAFLSSVPSNSIEGSLYRAIYSVHKSDVPRARARIATVRRLLEHHLAGTIHGSYVTRYDSFFKLQLVVELEEALNYKLLLHNSRTLQIVDRVLDGRETHSETSGLSGMLTQLTSRARFSKAPPGLRRYPSSGGHGQVTNTYSSPNSSTNSIYTISKYAAYSPDVRPIPIFPVSHIVRLSDYQRMIYAMNVNAPPSASMSTAVMTTSTSGIGGGVGVGGGSTSAPMLTSGRPTSPSAVGGSGPYTFTSTGTMSGTINSLAGGSLPSTSISTSILPASTSASSVSISTSAYLLPTPDIDDDLYTLPPSTLHVYPSSNDINLSCVTTGFSSQILHLYNSTETEIDPLNNVIQRSLIRAGWDSRLGIVTQTASIYQQLVSIRSLVLSPIQQTDAMLRLSKLYRERGLFSSSQRIITILLGENFMVPPPSSLPYSHVVPYPNPSSYLSPVESMQRCVRSLDVESSASIPTESTGSRSTPTLLVTLKTNQTMKKIIQCIVNTAAYTLKSQSQYGHSENTLSNAISSATTAVLTSNNSTLLQGLHATSGGYGSSAMPRYNSSTLLSDIAIPGVNISTGSGPMTSACNLVSYINSLSYSQNVQNAQNILIASDNASTLTPSTRSRHSSSVVPTSVTSASNALGVTSGATTSASTASTTSPSVTLAAVSTGMTFGSDNNGFIENIALDSIALPSTSISHPVKYLLNPCPITDPSVVVGFTQHLWETGFSMDAISRLKNTSVALEASLLQASSHQSASAFELLKTIAAHTEGAFIVQAYNYARSLQQIQQIQAQAQLQLQLQLQVQLNSQKQRQGVNASNSNVRVFESLSSSSASSSSSSSSTLASGMSSIPISQIKPVKIYVPGLGNCDIATWEDAKKIGTQYLSLVSRSTSIQSIIIHQKDCKKVFLTGLGDTPTTSSSGVPNKAKKSSQTQSHWAHLTPSCGCRLAFLPILPNITVSLSGLMNSTADVGVGVSSVNGSNDGTGAQAKTQGNAGNDIPTIHKNLSPPASFSSSGSTSGSHVSSTTSPSNILKISAKLGSNSLDNKTSTTGTSTSPTPNTYNPYLRSSLNPINAYLQAHGSGGKNGGHVSTTRPASSSVASISASCNSPNYGDPIVYQLSTMASPLHSSSSVTNVYTLPSNISYPPPLNQSKQVKQRYICGTSLRHLADWALWISTDSLSTASLTPSTLLSNTDPTAAATGKGVVGSTSASTSASASMTSSSDSSNSSLAHSSNSTQYISAIDSPYGIASLPVLPIPLHSFPNSITSQITSHLSSTRILDKRIWSLTLDSYAKSTIYTVDSYETWHGWASANFRLVHILSQRRTALISALTSLHITGRELAIATPSSNLFANKIGTTPLKSISNPADKSFAFPKHGSTSTTSLPSSSSSSSAIPHEYPSSGSVYVSPTSSLGLLRRATRILEYELHEIAYGLNIHTVAAVRGFIQSVILANSTSRVLQDILRVLTLWFQFGNEHAIKVVYRRYYRALRKLKGGQSNTSSSSSSSQSQLPTQTNPHVYRLYYNTAMLIRRDVMTSFNIVSVSTWTSVVPQAIARIGTSSLSVQQMIIHLLTKVGLVYPQVLIFPLNVASSSSVPPDLSTLQLDLSARDRSCLATKYQHLRFSPYRTVVGEDQDQNLDQQLENGGVSHRTRHTHTQSHSHPLDVLTSSNNLPSPSQVHNERTSEAATRIINVLRSRYPVLISQALVVSQELIRMAMIWIEQWHQAFEDASKYWFGQGNAELMLLTLLPLHTKLEYPGPSTPSELSFYHMFASQLNKAYFHLIKYMATGFETEIGQAWDHYISIFRVLSRMLAPKSGGVNQEGAAGAAGAAGAEGDVPIAVDTRNPDGTLDLEFDIAHISPRTLVSTHLKVAIPGTYVVGHSYGFENQSEAVSASTYALQVFSQIDRTPGPKFVTKTMFGITIPRRVRQLFAPGPSSGSSSGTTGGIAIGVGGTRPTSTSTSSSSILSSNRYQNQYSNIKLTPPPTTLSNTTGATGIGGQKPSTVLQYSSNKTTGNTNINTNVNATTAATTSASTSSAISTPASAPIPYQLVSSSQPPITTIAAFLPKLHVIESKQRPRKISILGSDGKCYNFLLKGREDLRQDTRAMQLFSLINYLLSASHSSSSSGLRQKDISGGGGSGSGTGSSSSSGSGLSSGLGFGLGSDSDSIGTSISMDIHDSISTLYGGTINTGNIGASSTVGGNYNNNINNNAGGSGSGSGSGSGNTQGNNPYDSASLFNTIFSTPSSGVYGTASQAPFSFISGYNYNIPGIASNALNTSGNSGISNANNNNNNTHGSSASSALFGSGSNTYASTSFEEVIPADAEYNMRSIRGYSVTPLSPISGVIQWLSGCDTMHNLVKEYRQARHLLLNVENRLASTYTGSPTVLQTLSNVQKLECFHYILRHSHDRKNDLHEIMWLRAATSEVWLRKRNCFSRSLAVMSIVGYILGLGDRHPCNIMVKRSSGKVIHIDFGDCFEVAMQRDRLPEKVPFRLTRMLTNALEVGGLHGCFKQTAESTMKMLRNSKDSVMSVLEAFVHDPLVTWKLVYDVLPGNDNQKNKQKTEDEDTTAGVGGVGGTITGGKAAVVRKNLRTAQTTTTSSRQTSTASNNDDIQLGIDNDDIASAIAGIQGSVRNATNNNIGIDDNEEKAMMSMFANSSLAVSNSIMQSVLQKYTTMRNNNTSNNSSISGTIGSVSGSSLSSKIASKINQRNELLKQRSIFNQQQSHSQQSHSQQSAQITPQHGRKNAPLSNIIHEGDEDKDTDVEAEAQGHSQLHKHAHAHIYNNVDIEFDILSDHESESDSDSEIDLNDIDIDIDGDGDISMSPSLSTIGSNMSIGDLQNQSKATTTTTVTPTPLSLHHPNLPLPETPTTPSGSGKSSLLSRMNTYFNTSSGSATTAGRTSSGSISDLRRGGYDSSFVTAAFVDITSWLFPSQLDLDESYLLLNKGGEVNLEALNSKALAVIARVESKLTGRDFVEDTNEKEIQLLENLSVPFPDEIDLSILDDYDPTNPVSRAKYAEMFDDIDISEYLSRTHIRIVGFEYATKTKTVKDMKTGVISSTTIALYVNNDGDENENENENGNGNNNDQTAQYGHRNDYIMQSQMYATRRGHNQNNQQSISGVNSAVTSTGEDGTTSKDGNVTNNALVQAQQTLHVQEQVARLIEQAISYIHLSQAYIGWCSFW